MDMQTGLKLQKLRKERGLSQEELANQLNVSRQAVSKWERGEASPDTDNLILLSKLYNTSLDKLVANENNEKSAVPEKPKRKLRTDMVGLITAITFPVTVTIYLLLGCLWGLWHPGWIIFFTCFLVPSLAMAIRKKKWNIFCFPIFILAVYLCLGFIWNLWHHTWIIFLFIPIIPSLIFSIEKKKGVLFQYPILVVAIYLCLGFIWGLWHPAWIIFTTIPIYYIIFSYVDNKK